MRNKPFFWMMGTAATSSGSENTGSVLEENGGRNRSQPSSISETRTCACKARKLFLTLFSHSLPLTVSPSSSVSARDNGLSPRVQLELLLDQVRPIHEN
jgi:hypothetical protein